MGQQQLLLIILGVIIVGIAIAVGLSLFSAQSIQANKDAIINDMNNIAAYCYQYRIRPASMDGGNGSYTTLTQDRLPSKLRSNSNATYVVSAPGAASITITGTSNNDAAGTVQAVLGSNGELTGWTYGSYFQ
jgi:hypothetical protein